jgi:hypothetical protein
LRVASAARRFFEGGPIATSPAAKHASSWTISRVGRHTGSQALHSAVSAGANKGEGVSRLVRVLSSCQVSPKGVGKASTYHATAAVHAISWLALEHFGGGLGASKVGDEGDC